MVLLFTLGPHCKVTYVCKQPVIYVTKINCYYILNYKEKLRNNFSKIIKCIVKTRVGSKVGEMTRF